VTQLHEPSLLHSPTTKLSLQEIYNPPLTLFGVMKEESVSKHYPPNSASLPHSAPGLPSLALSQSIWRLVYSTAFHFHSSYRWAGWKSLRRGRIHVTLLCERANTGKRFSVPHPSLFAFLTAGNSKMPPSAHNHAGMLQKDLQITSLP